MAELQNTSFDTKVIVSNGSQSSPSITNDNNSASGFYFSGQDELIFTSAAEQKMRITSSGYVQFFNQPAFYIRHTETTNRVNSGQDIQTWGSELLNRGNHFNRSNGRFTAPVDGVYHFTFWAQEETYYGNWGTHSVNFAKNGNNDLNFGNNGSLEDETSENWIYVEGIMYMNAGDYMTVRFNAADNTPSFENVSGGISGFLIG